MMTGERHRVARCSTLFFVALGALAAVPAKAESFLLTPPLEFPADRHANIATAEMVARDSVTLSFGLHQLDAPAGSGTGLQNFSAAVTWHTDGPWQFALSGQVYDDPPAAPIAGDMSNVTFMSFGGSAKRTIASSHTMRLAFEAGLEAVAMDGTIFATGNSPTWTWAGALRLPTTFDLSPEFRAHLVPSVQIFEDSINGQDFFGVTGSFGFGMTWQPVDRMQAYAAVVMPFGPGGNTIRENGEIGQDAVWTAGIRHAITPRLAVNAFLTNGFGMTPVTESLTFSPDGTEVAAGVRFDYTPGAWEKYRTSYRTVWPTTRVIVDETRPDGITLTTADTLSPGQGRLSFALGSDGQASAAILYSPDQDIQLEAIIEDFAQDDSVGLHLNPDPDPRYMLGGRLQLFDQSYGDLFSASARLLLGRDVEKPTVGVWYADLAATWHKSETTAFTVTPRYASFGDEEIIGLGAGISHELNSDITLFGEVTAVDGDGQAVWAVGTRFGLPGEWGALDAFATNAIGHHGLGSVVAQNSARVGIRFSRDFGATVR